MRRIRLLSLGLLAALSIPASAQAAFPTDAFNGTVACSTQAGPPAAIAGQVWCGAPANTTVQSFDNTPIDVGFYTPSATVPSGGFPVVGVFHGYAGSKIPPSSATSVQRWLSRGYAVFTMTDRGFNGSCGAVAAAGNPGGCAANGYVHLLSSQWEVRDAQYLLGVLADDTLIAPKKVGATGQSYGGGMSMQLGALKNRVVLGAKTGETNGQLTAWKSAGGKDMEIAATAPEFGWSNLASALVPNGSTLDYAALNPYRGPVGSTARAGVEKDSWVESLYFGGINPTNGYYCGLTAACPDARYNLPAIRGALTGAPSPTTPDTTTPSPAYDGNTTVQNALDEIDQYHSAYSVADSTAPAPQLLSNGWNDDLFPVSEAVRYYNKVRQDNPDTPINLWAFDWGHPTRGPGTAVNTDNATSLFAAEGLWFDFYVRGIGSAPQDPKGGANTIASGCSDDTSSATLTSSPLVHASSWAALQNGELTVDNAAAQAITATNTSAATFQPFPTSTSAPTVCTTQANTDTTGAATYTVASQANDYTILGSPTVKVDITTGNANDSLIARLYDVNTGADNRRLIARAMVRPNSATTGTAQTQVFQLHPQQWKVVTGHTLKLELMASDAPYARPTAGQAAMSVKNLELRVPTVNAPSGNITAPAAKAVPSGYTLARDFVTPTPTVTTTPEVTPTVTPEVTPTVTPDVTPTVTPKPTTKKIRVEGRIRKVKSPGRVVKGDIQARGPCDSGRKVVVFKRASGVKLGIDRSSKTGKFRIRTKKHSKGKLLIKVRKKTTSKYVCRVLEKRVPGTN